MLVPRRTIEGETPEIAGPEASAPPHARCRSFCYLDRNGEQWLAFLVTYPDEGGLYRGYFSFRPTEGDPDLPEVRTASLFVENSEAEVDYRARGLGRPLLLALLESALDTHERRQGASPDTQRWFRQILAENAAGLVPDIGPDPTNLTLSHLRSLYDSYRLDQVAHLIALIDPEDFRVFVEQVLDGQTIDFRARDRLQFAMIVVQELERRLKLPPFEIWVEDYLAHREEYQIYSHALHRGGELP